MPARTTSLSPGHLFAITAGAVIAASGPTMPSLEAQPSFEMASFAAYAMRIDSPVVTRVCHIFTSGALYCRNVDDLLQKEFKGASAQVFRGDLAEIYQRYKLDRSRNGLMDCGSGTWASASQTIGELPSKGDVEAGLNACLGQLGKEMPQGANGVPSTSALGGVTLSTSSGGRGGTTCGMNGDPRRSEDPGTTKDGVPPEPLTTPSQDAKDNAKFWAMMAEKYRSWEGREDAYKVAKENAADWAKEARRLEKKERNEARNKGGSGKERPGADGNPCSEAKQVGADRIAECNRNAWSSYECQKMKQCTDPAITDPGQDDEMMTCGSVVVYGGDRLLRDAIIRKCEATRKPGPDGNTGCSLKPMETSDGLKKLCIDPRALVTESCLESGNVTIGFPTLGRSLAQVSAGLCKMTGGVGCFTPTTNTTVGPRGPVGPRNLPAARAPQLPAKPPIPPST